MAIEQCIFLGIPINVTLLFSPNHYLAAAQAYMRGIQRRIEHQLDPVVGCVASLFISRWDASVKDRVVPDLKNRLGIAIAKQTYHLYQELLASAQWQNLAAAGALPQRLLWASTGTKDPSLKDTYYVESRGAADTINTLPESTLLAFADHGVVTPPLTAKGSDAQAVLAAFAQDGISISILASRLQQDGLYRRQTGFSLRHAARHRFGAYHDPVRNAYFPAVKLESNREIMA